MKKTLAFLLALAMVLSLTATAFATDVTEAPTEAPSEPTGPSSEIQILNPYTDHTYTAYQLFTGEVVDVVVDDTTEESTEPSTGESTEPSTPVTVKSLVGIKWGSHVNQADDDQDGIINMVEELHTEFKTVDPETSAETSPFQNVKTAGDFAAALEDLYENQKVEGIDKALVIIHKHMNPDVAPIAGALDTVTGDYFIPARDTAGSPITENLLASGYYLVIDEDTTPAVDPELLETNSTISPLMVKVVGGTTAIEHKANEIGANVMVLDTDFELENGSTGDKESDGSVWGIPTEGNWQSGWQKFADYNIGDRIPVLSSVSFSGDLTEYDYQNILVTNVLDAGLTVPDDFTILAQIKTGSTTIDSSYTVAEYDGTGTQTDELLYTLTITGDENGDGQLSEEEIAAADPATVGQTIIKVFPNKTYGDGNTPADDVNGGNLKKLVEDQESGVTTSNNLVLLYAVTLDSDAAIGRAGNGIQTKVKFTRDPYTYEMGESAYARSIVFTYALDVTKVDNLDDTIFLPGAKFGLYRMNPDVSSYEQARIDPDTGTIIDWSTNSVDPDSIVFNANNTWFYPDSILTTDENGKLNFTGLDDGVYSLFEYEAPAGYDLPKAPVIVDIQAVHNETWGTGAQLKTLQIQTKIGENGTYGELVGGENEAESGTVSTTITNSFNVVLPETGGVGTTLFYIIGGLMVVAAAVVLVTKRRMSV